jgi:hypothetical protein
VRVVLAEHVSDHGRGLLEGLARLQSYFMHRKEYSPVDGFESVTRVRERAADDYAHGVVQITTLHLFFDIDWNLLNRFSHSITLSLISS